MRLSLCYEDTMSTEIDISEQDVYEAMKDIEGFLDISMRDFQELYKHAIQHARQRLLDSTSVEAIMTDKVVCADEQTALEQLVDILGEKNISGMPVVDGKGKVVGVVSEKDIFFLLTGEKGMKVWQLVSGCMHGSGCRLSALADRKAAEIMTSPAITLRKSESAHRALELFRDHKINRVPVVDDDGMLAGIVTRTDLLHAHLQIDG